jgi:glutathione synthase
MKNALKSKKSRRFLWITDPWDTLDHSRDTSLRLAEEALLLGHEAWWCDVKTVRVLNSRAVLDAARIEDVGRARDSFKLSAAAECSPLDFHSLQYRVDPPVDLAYLQPLQILRIALESAPRSSSRAARRPEIVNPISALFLANEKLEGMLLPGLTPPSVVSTRWEPLLEFGLREGRTVLKPLHTAQSKGIELLDWTRKAGIEHARASIAEASGAFERPVLLQRYLPGIAGGETRLWFLDGSLLACARKLPLENDFRVDIDRGSRLAPHAPTATEKRAATAISRRLRVLGVRLAAVDLIEDFVTDFNLTSPGLITQMEKITGRNLARPIIEALLLPGKSAR